MKRSFIHSLGSLVVPMAVAAGFSACSNPDSRPDQAKAPVAPESKLDPMAKAKYELTYAVVIPKPTTRFHYVETWIPMPADSPEQKVVEAKVECPVTCTQHVEPKYKNKMLHLKLDEKTAFPVSLKLTYVVLRTPAQALTQDQVPDGLAWNPAHFLRPDRRVPVDGLIRKIAQEETQGLKTQDEKIKKIYTYVAESMTYNKDGTGWGQGDAIWACSNKRGNCTDFHSLLIGMARSQKIPAKFEMGLPIPPSGEGEIPGYHCWARMFSETQGWIPVDASESKKAGDLMKFYGHFPADRIAFTTGRDLILAPKQRSSPLNYFVYPHTEVDGKAVELAKHHFSVKHL